MHNTSDTGSDLLALVAAGDWASYEKLYNTYYLGVFRFAMKFLENRQAAEDITTEAFIKLWNTRDDLAAIRNIPSFLFTIVRNACLNHLRDLKRHAAHHSRILDSLSGQSEEGLRQHEIAEEVFRYLDNEIKKLPPRQQAILRCHLEGMKQEEISHQLGIAIKTVRNLKSEAVKTLRIALGKKDLFALFLLYLSSFREY